MLDNALVGAGWMKTNTTAQRARPRTMNGVERSRIRRRPMVSMRIKAMTVKRKFVPATEREVPIGDVKPTMAKMVAEKYMREFYKVAFSVFGSVLGEGSWTYKPAQLLESLQHASNRQRASMTRHTNEIIVRRPPEALVLALDRALEVNLLLHHPQHILHILLLAQAQQHLPRLAHPPFHEQQSRALGHAPQQHKLQHSGQCARTNSNPPLPLHRPANNVCDHLPTSDEQTLHRHQPSPGSSRRNLGNVQRHNAAGSADGRADHAPANDHDPDARGERLRQRADHEEDRGERNDGTSAKHVGCVA